ncbi:MAG: fibronectin type III domain-containing protein, partial [Spirochaetia bacterium]|nr:fibronectin type III domain-containing protein [Spirochaetia bacterium]
TGNTYTPGQSWSEWTPVDKNQVTNRAARFIQLRFELSGTGSGSPELSDIRIYYGQENKTSSLSFFSAGRNPEFEKNFKLNLAEDDLLLSWDLHNDDGDPIYYKLAYKSALLGDWKEIGGRFRNKYHIFKKGLLPDGEYFFKVVLCDVNAGTGAAETDSLASRKVTIDNTAPAVRDASLKNGILTFKVSDNLSPVYRVEYSWLFEDFRPLLPSDGVNDSREESYTLKAPDNAAFVVLRVTDDAGNANYESFEIKGGNIQPTQKK